jgi:hypothetical protein
MLAMLSTGKHIYSYFWNKYEFIKVDDWNIRLFTA